MDFFFPFPFFFLLEATGKKTTNCAVKRKPSHWRTVDSFNRQNKCTLLILNL